MEYFTLEYLTCLLNSSKRRFMKMWTPYKLLRLHCDYTILKYLFGLIMDTSNIFVAQAVMISHSFYVKKKKKERESGREEGRKSTDI